MGQLMALGNVSLIFKMDKIISSGKLIMRIQLNNLSNMHNSSWNMNTEWQLLLWIMVRLLKLITTICLELLPNLGKYTVVTKENHKPFRFRFLIKYYVFYIKTISCKPLLFKNILNIWSSFLHTLIYFSWSFLPMHYQTPK